MWAVTLLEPQVWVASFGPGAVLKLATLGYGVLALFVMASFPRFWFPLLSSYALFTVISVPLAAGNTGLALGLAKLIVGYTLLGLATFAFVKTPRQAMPIVLLYVFQYGWWELHAGTSGLVAWHYSYGNYDAYGPLMVQAVTLCYFCGLGARSPRLKWALWGLAGLAVLGIVASFARGAVLGAAAVIIYVWLRSPRKGQTAGGLAIAGVVVLIATRILFPGGAFWTEMQSAFTEGTEEGTGADRWALWSAGVRVFQARPLIGVGPQNFGAFAATYFRPGEVGDQYADNPARLWGRRLHSIYVQILCEGGIVGSALFLALLADFVARNRRLRTRQASAAWDAGGGEALQLRALSLGLECAMIAYLVTGFFYDQLDVHWLYTLLIVNALLWHLCVGTRKRRTRQRA